MNSILTSVKKALGIQEDYDHFDDVIVMHINTVFMILMQLGVGPAEGFSIEDDSSEWTDYIPEGSNLEAVKTYMHHRVRMMFDPPNGGVMESMNRIISELECRLNMQVDTKTPDSEE